MKNLHKGKKGEDLAVNHLKKANYTILERNYRYRWAEIDIIAFKNKTLVFVEVKMRSKTAFGFPEEFVSEGQESRILNASAFYLEQNPLVHQFTRFDIIAIICNKQQYELHHIQDAFH